MAASKNIRSIVVGPETWARLKNLAAKEERSMSELLREALLDIFKKREPGAYDPATDSFKRQS